MDANKDYSKIKATFAELTARERKLESELNIIEEDQKKHIKELATIEAQTERQLESINTAKREESTINEDELHKKCKEAIDYFLQDISSSKTQAGFSLPIRIEYQQMKIFKNIIDENITFEKLKEETKNQFGKEGDEFFFADINGSIYLDGLRVTPALFPLSNVKVDKYEPVVYVVDKMPLKTRRDHNDIKEFNEFGNSNSKDDNDDIDWYDDYFALLKKNFFNHFLLIILIIFVGLYSQNCLDYRQGDVYKNLSLSLHPKAADFKNAFDKVDYNKFMETVQDKLDLFYDVGDKANDPFYNAMIPLKFIRMIQKVSKVNIACSSERMTYVDGKNCIDTIEYSYEPIIINGLTHEYMNQTSYKKIKGEFDYYDNSGVILDIFINKPLIIPTYPNWLTESTASIIIIMNFYSLNTDSIVILRFLFEQHNNIFLPNHNIQFLNLTQTFNGFLIACIILSLIMLVLLFYMIKSPQSIDSSPHQLHKDAPPPTKPCFFRCPSIVEVFTLLNILFFYAMLIFRFTFLSNLSISSTMNQYEDYQSYQLQYDQVTEACCFNLIFFYMIIIGFLKDYLDEFNTISKAMASFLKIVYPYAILFIVMFFLVSMLVSYELFGDYPKVMYRDLTFVFLKVVQSFFRGSLDHIDYADRRLLDDKWETGVIHSYWNIMDHSGCTGYITYVLMYFIIVMLMVKGFVLGNYIITYREGYVRKVSDLERMRREAVLAEKHKVKATAAAEEKKKLLQKEIKARQDTEEANIISLR